MTMKGETLIEVLIALSVAVIVITSVSFLSVSSLNNSAFVKDQNQASKYTQEGLEVARSIRNSNYTGFAAYTGTYCLAKDQTALGSAVASCQVPNIDDQYIRSVTITQNNGCGVNFANILVTVSWTSTKCSDGTYCHSSKLNSCFSTTSPVAGP
ncbi:MAG TPA: hypothetical protein VLF20_05355 [Patescibacteria group bacterium]|nr:hypothetical protein [Patescibacteria group bacterium]